MVSRFPLERDEVLAVTDRPSSNTHVEVYLHVEHTMLV